MPLSRNLMQISMATYPTFVSNTLLLLSRTEDSFRLHITEKSSPFIWWVRKAWLGAAFPSSSEACGTPSLHPQMPLSCLRHACLPPGLCRAFSFLVPWGRIHLARPWHEVSAPAPQEEALFSLAPGRGPQLVVQIPGPRAPSALPASLSSLSLHDAASKDHSSLLYCYLFIISHYLFRLNYSLESWPHISVSLPSHLSSLTS